MTPRIFAPIYFMDRRSGLKYLRPSSHMMMKGMIVVLESLMNEMNAREDIQIMMTLLSLLPHVDQVYYAGIFSRQVVKLVGMGDTKVLLDFVLNTMPIIYSSTASIDPLLPDWPNRMNDDDILHMWILPDIVWKRSSLRRIVGLLHRSLMQTTLCEASYKLSSEWLRDINHGMTNREVIIMMYPDSTVPIF